jgi:hypothetical protein
LDKHSATIKDSIEELKEFEAEEKGTEDDEEDEMQVSIKNKDLVEPTLTMQKCSLLLIKKCSELLNDMKTWEGNQNQIFILDEIAVRSEILSCLCDDVVCNLYENEPAQQDAVKLGDTCNEIVELFLKFQDLEVPTSNMESLTLSEGKMEQNSAKKPAFDKQFAQLLKAKLDSAIKKLK